MKLAIIPARGGSQRIRRKNIKMFHGKPIIQYSIEVAERSGLFDEIIVSTDDEEIAGIANKCGASVIVRPSRLALDQVGTQRVAAHACERWLGDNVKPEDMACVIYATSPLLDEQDLLRGLRALESNRNNDFAFSVGDDPLHDAGQFYWGYAWAFIKNRRLIGERTVMVPISKDRVCDINTPADWARAEVMYEKLHK